MLYTHTEIMLIKDLRDTQMNQGSQDQVWIGYKLILILDYKSYSYYTARYSNHEIIIYLQKNGIILYGTPFNLGKGFI